MPVLRQDTHAITVIVDGRNTGTWAKMSGGDIDSEETTYKPGAMAPQVSLGGSQTTSNVTVERGYDPLVDDLHALAAGVGESDVTVIAQPLDAKRNAFGRARVYEGTLKALSMPEADAEGGSNAAMYSLEVTPSGGLA